MAAGLAEQVWEVEEVVAEDEKVAIRWSLQGSHTGELFGVAPSQRTVTVPGIEIYRVLGHRVAEYWGVADLSELSGQ